MNAKRKPYMLTNQNSTAFWLIDNLWMPLATSYQTQDNFSLMEQVCGIGIGGPQAHSHPMDEGMYILEGHASYQAGGQEIKAGPGTFISIPRYTEHSFNIDAPGTRLLNFYTPGGFELLIMSLGIPAAERRVPEPGTTPMPPRWMAMESSREFGQIAAASMPIADPPTEENRKTKPSLLNPIRPYAVQLDQAPAYWAEESLFMLLATEGQTGGAYSLLYQRCPRSSGPAPHMHEQDEAFYILDGALTLIAGSENFSVKAGSFLYIPAGTIHSFRIDSPEAQLFNWYLPGGFEKAITDLGEPARTRSLPPATVKGNRTPEQQKALFSRIGMTTIAMPDTLRESNSQN